MKKRNIVTPPAPAEENDAPAEEEKRVSAAERLGREMLARLGADDETDEDELAEAIIEIMAGMNDGAEAPARRGANELDDDVRDPFGTMPKMPVPMRTGSGSPKSTDYSEMSTKQFNELKKLLKKASADGKRIRL
ncbi:MAG: hypothetical protein II155_00045 [Clostridia bacterium]|nr:hypothetical protein [Clostridia bacterium]